uniref:Uncharacterized protein n=1 Tax=Avena sativa TaxID=4498 RepID=A0ACD5UWR1_AVESA
MISISSSSRRGLVGTTGAATFQLMVVALAAGPIALPGCPESCGDIAVPYPFGIGQGCFHEGFNLTCVKNTKLLLGDGMEVLDISLPDGTVRINSNILQSDSGSDFNGTWSGPPATGPFMVSSRYNWFVAYGCNIVAQLIPYGAAVEDISTCASMCVGNRYTTTSMCSGIGTCQASIFLELASYSIQFRHIAVQDSMTRKSLRYEGSAAFIVEKAWFIIYQSDIEVDPNDATFGRFSSGSVPVVLEWSLHSKSRCQSSNSIIYKVDNNTDQLRCNCSQGYEGNPYIGDGCQDIDECQQPGVYPCLHGTCINMQGTYRCTATKSISSLRGLITGIAISAGFGLLFSLLGVSKITNKLKKRRAKKLRQKFYKKNHGFLVQQLISSNKDVSERTKIFSLEELEQSTNKFDQNRILGCGGHGTVYKGILSDQRVVAIKKAKSVIQREIDQFVNEIVILSETNHRNVVKLFGCCLETEVPLLVYEFISNGTLSFHLHGKNENPLSWKDRLKIALEAARAVAYLHSAASVSVYHRDIKCANILLTDTLTAKVSDFGASRSIAIHETGILTAVQGTYGYLDPEYYYTSRLTEKSDVYSFGVILAELLTRVTPVFSSHSSEVTSIASYFVSVVRDNRLSDILDAQIVDEGGADEAEAVARLTEECLSLKGEERPTMRQVEMTLENVLNSKVKVSSQITRVNQNAMNDQSYKGSKGGEGTRLYSLEKEFIQSSEIPR